MRTAIFLLLVLVVSIALFLLSATPVVNMPSSVTALGQSTPVTITVADPHGVHRVAAFIEQDGTRYPVWEAAQPRRRFFWQRGNPQNTWTFAAGTATTPQLKDGKAQLIVEAASNDLRGKTVTASREVTVVTQPPTVSVDSDQHYLYLGMADLVTFTVSGYWTEAGVRVGNESFRGWPMPGGKLG